MLRWAVAVVLVVGLAGCGSDKDTEMPDVTGKKLDVAKSAINDAGFEDEVKVEGGGVFGVVKESNWEVCDQTPAAGEVVTNAPQLTVDRSCDDISEEPSATPSESPTPVATEPSAPATEQILTAKTNKEFAALLKVSDCDDVIAPFAAKYNGRTIAFDGSIAAAANHGDYDTRFDFLLFPGSKGPESVVGPAFKFEDVNRFDLNITGKDVPDGVSVGDRFRFIAEVGEYNPDTCLFFLDPIETKVR